jgi:sugar phosphate isomerase/epimerase
MREWCDLNGVDRHAHITKSALWAYLRVLRESDPEKYKKYEVDAIAREAGLEIARLPPYNSHLNPIEMIWAIFKQRVRKANTASLMNKATHLRIMEQLVAEVFATITGEEVGNTRRHCADLWRKYALGPVVHIVEDTEDTDE